ncbi:MAG: MarR family transcriptional regulator [Syntrophaceae bacterium]|jgi:DNA-binding MarR family transcriptional regulator|nr:MarR family transcriptional regulator [Syntrophaceae bacterium]
MTLKVEDCIFFLLARAQQAGVRFWTQALADTTLTAVQAMVVNFLGRRDPITAKELSERTGLDTATLTGVIDRLEASGWIERRRHPSDRRAIHILLSDRGRNIVPLLQKKMEKANREFLAALSDNEQQEFRRLLRAVRNPDAVLPPAE